MAHAKKDLFSQDIAQLAHFAQALAHPARIEILRIIGLSENTEMACLEITKQLPLSQATCSRHIAVLKRSGLIRARVDANFVYYSLQPDILESFCSAMHATLEPAIRSSSAKPAAEKIAAAQESKPMQSEKNISTPAKNEITEKSVNSSSFATVKKTNQNTTK
jgi:DNA-binding transcriptional ArsR family regulator